VPRIYIHGYLIFISSMKGKLLSSQWPCIVVIQWNKSVCRTVVIVFHFSRIAFPMLQLLSSDHLSFLFVCLCV